MEEEYKKRKEEIEKLTKSLRNLVNKILILDLLYNDNLYDLIIKLKEEKIRITNPTIIEKKYLTSYEQFLYVLDNFITYMIKIFNSVEIAHTIIPRIIKENNEILFSRYYFYTSYNTRKYIKGFNKMIVNNFYNNCLILKDELSPYYDTLNIKLEKLNINKYNDSIKIILLLEEIFFISRNKYGVIALFEKITKENYKQISTQYDRLFYDYERNIDFVKQYRDFRERNGIYT